MTTFKDQLQKAIINKKNDVSTFVWKFPKKKVGDRFIQDEIKLMDATEEQLNTFYKHCLTMLYNKDSKNIGRYPLLTLIREQRTNCNAMLLINWLATGGPNRKAYPRFQFFQDFKTELENNRDSLPRNTWATAKITNLYEVPVEFHSLTIQSVFDACLDTLGVFDKRHITNNFIIKMGLWFTQEEMKDLNEKDENGKMKNRLDVVRQRCDLHPDVKLFINQKGLTYREFRAMKNLKSKRYSELTTDQLTILRDKILFKLEEEVNTHIQQWEDRIKQIKKVASIKGYNLDEVEID